MSNWTDEVMAKQTKQSMKDDTLAGFDRLCALGFDHEEAKVALRGMVPEEVSYIRVLVDHWIDTERPTTR